MLKQMGSIYGFQVEVLDKVMDGSREISSTYIREELLKGHMEKVNELLGYPYTVTGEVIHGHQLGRTIRGSDHQPDSRRGQASAAERCLCIQNQGCRKEILRNHKYWHKAHSSGKVCGCGNPSFDCDMDLYGEEAKVELYHYQRPEQKFPSVEALKQQLYEDEKCGKEYFRL